MMRDLKAAIQRSLKGARHRFVGHMLFCLLWFVIVIFCGWFKKAMWNEPLGVDGLILSVVLFYIVYRALPVIEKLINR
jgi:hypothetical protein